MKIISLNTWAAKREDELRTFIQAHLATTDIFCFQEVKGSTIETLLDDLFSTQNYYRIEAHKYIHENEKFDLVTLVRNNYQAALIKELFTVTESDVGQALAVGITIGNDVLQIVNVHGISRPGNKLDTKGRLRQSQHIIDFIHQHDIPTIVMGDFNLDIATESVATFAKSGLRDLVHEYKIPATRNKITWERYPDNPQRYADYTFISKDIKICDFQVIDNQASDHLPMSLSIDENSLHSLPTKARIVENTRRASRSQ